MREGPSSSLDGKADGEDEQDEWDEWEEREPREAPPDLVEIDIETLNSWSWWLHTQRNLQTADDFPAGPGLRWDSTDIATAMRNARATRLSDVAIGGGLQRWANDHLREPEQWNMGELYDVPVPTDREPHFWWERGRPTMFRFADDRAAMQALEAVIDKPGEPLSYGMRDHLIVDAAILERYLSTRDRSSPEGEREYQITRTMLAMRETAIRWLSGGD